MGTGAMIKTCSVVCPVPSCTWEAAIVFAYDDETPGMDWRAGVTHDALNALRRDHVLATHVSMVAGGPTRDLDAQ